LMIAAIAVRLLSGFGSTSKALNLEEQPFTRTERRLCGEAELRLELLGLYSYFSDLTDPTSSV